MDEAFKYPENYKHKPGSIILIDDKGNPWFQHNKDGSVSGLELISLGMKDAVADGIFTKLMNINGSSSK